MTGFPASRAGLPVRSSKRLMETLRNRGSPYRLPAALAALPYAQRRITLRSAINGVGAARPLASEEPNPADPAFAARVAHWRRRLDLPEVQAVVLAILEETPEPSEQTRAVLEGIERGRMELPDDEVGRWLAGVVRWLCGASAPIIVAPGS